MYTIKTQGIQHGEEIKNKRDELSRGHIAKMDGPTPRLNLLVMVSKAANNEARLCIDMRVPTKLFHSSQKNYDQQNEVLNDMQAGSVFRKLEWKW